MNTSRVGLVLMPLEPRRDLEKGGPAGAIGTHETGLVAFEEPERRLFEERPGQPGLLLLRLLLFLPHALALGHVLTPLRRVIIPCAFRSRLPRVA